MVDARKLPVVEYLRLCSPVKLAALYLNDEITTTEYFRAIKERGVNDE